MRRILLTSLLVAACLVPVTGQAADAADAVDTALVLALGDEAGNRFFGRAHARAHDDDHALGVLGAHVLEGLVAPAGHLGELVEDLVEDPRHRVVERVDRLAGLEEHVRVLGGTAQHRVVRRSMPIRPITWSIPTTGLSWMLSQAPPIGPRKLSRPGP